MSFDKPKVTRANLNDLKEGCRHRGTQDACPWRRIRDDDFGAGGCFLIPGTSYQLIVAVALVLPGIVFGTTLQRLRGPTPEDKDASTRILRAIAVGAALDVLYALAFGPKLVQLAHPAPGRQASLLSIFTANPREIALWVALLAGAVPALAAFCVHFQSAFRETSREISIKKRLADALKIHYRTTPTAWDYIAREGGCFIRVRLSDGVYFGGWIDEQSFVSGYPEPKDIFIRSQWALNEKGVFLHKIQGTRGVYIPVSDGVVVEWLSMPDQVEDGSSVEPPETEKQEVKEY
ncbi:DUF6338 family protein [Amycolatopsis sp. EV170708-02-1]|uniref:DUF6338 family protein n=1 Tax=Amycolatopsis sp. EV170708-02-1 TaxID=2919322 RepID=UPI001F0C2AF4|nr:DUF6338 family protein [Amycolatopsis sp. EV170708-02-1]UMP07167.1 DUF6338 family protein [Amycolatopsis sp. EV170708-02-1]